MGKPVVHFEITGKNAAKLQQFYANTFDWKIDTNNPMDYGMVAAGGSGGIGGGVGSSGEGPAGVTFYIQVDDLQATLNQVEKAGGKTVMPPMDLPGGPSLAQFTDPEGNRIGLVVGM